MTIFLLRSCAVIFASTFAPVTSGAPTFTASPAPTRRTSPNVTVSPTLPGSFSTLSLSPAATRYCLPPVLITAYMRTLLGAAREQRARAAGKIESIQNVDPDVGSHGDGERG